MNDLLSGSRLPVVEEMLADLGCASVTAAATVEQALSLIDARSFDVAMLDVNLNGTMSYPVADGLAARGVPFLFATGYGRHGLRDGYQDQIVLPKPYRPNDLSTAPTELLGRPTEPATGAKPRPPRAGF